MHVATVWLSLIAPRLRANGKFFDIAARAAVTAVGAFALARLRQAQVGTALAERQHGVPALGSPAQG
jgi:hypothetical protein